MSEILAGCMRDGEMWVWAVHPSMTTFMLSGVFYQTDYHQPSKGWPQNIFTRLSQISWNNIRPSLIRFLFILGLADHWSLWLRIRYFNTPMPWHEQLFNIKSIHSHCIDRKYMRKWSDIEILFLFKSSIHAKLPHCVCFKFAIKFFGTGTEHWREVPPCIQLHKMTVLSKRNIILTYFL